MVTLQCMVVVGAVAGTSTPACGSSDQCHQAGTYCKVGVNNRCDFCGEDHPLPLQADPATGGGLNDPYAPGFAGFNITAVAELCADPSLYTSNSYTVSSIMSWCKSCGEALDLLLI
jgi:hypothetical protein